MNTAVAFLERTAHIGPVIFPYGLMLALSVFPVTGFLIGDVLWRVFDGDGRVQAGIDQAAAVRVAARRAERREDTW